MFTIPTSIDLAVGSIVLTAGIVARVSRFAPDGRPILAQVESNFRARGGQWVADPSQCRLLTTTETVRFAEGNRAF